ncbi:MAG TPA: hypothetical protein VL625_00620 [Patescibacteria group bacterium]|nr:hypothetical protein [Patescibacteria group bacterium]
MLRSAIKKLCLLVALSGLLAYISYNEARAGENHDTLTANISAYSGSKPFAGGAADIEAFNRNAAASIRHLLTGIRGIHMRVESNTGVYEGWVEPSLSLTIQTPSARETEQVLSCLAAFARHYSQHQIHVLRPGSAAATPDPGDFDTDFVRFNLPRPLSRLEIEHVIQKSGLPGMTFNASHVEVYYAGAPGDRVAREKFRIESAKAGQEIDRIAGSRSPARHNVQALEIYGRGPGASSYAKISTTNCPGNF